MALRNQPYLPLYVDDFLSDEKLSLCSAESTGVYIRLMCLMHKSDDYGVISLSKLDKATDNQIDNFAVLLSKQMPYETSIISPAISELIERKVIQIKGDKLLQKRMVSDGELSRKRAVAGSIGGKQKSSKISIKSQAISVNGNGIVNEYGDDIKPTGEKLKTSSKQDERFTQFWQAYPHKVGKQDAIKAFAKVDVDIGVLLTALEKQKNSEQWQKDGGKFIPHPATWLNGKRWEDELEPSTTTFQPQSRKPRWVQDDPNDYTKGHWEHDD